MTTQTEKKVPALRFPGFDGAWSENVLGEIATFSKGKGISKAELEDNGSLECITYGELYTRYSELIDEVKSRTNLDPGTLVLSDPNDVIIPASGETHIDIATASCVLRGGIALGGDLNIIKAEAKGVFLAYYLNNARKKDIASLAQGSSVIHLYSRQLKSLKLFLPLLPEQQKIAAFLTAIDTRIQQLTRKVDLLEQYKKGVMQQLFSQAIRFKPDARAGSDDQGRDFPAWEEVKLSKVLKEHKLKSEGTEEVFSVSVHKGLINQIEHLGRRFAAKTTSHYNRVKPGDIVYTKSPTGDFPYGIIKQSRVYKNVIVSPLYGVFTPETPALGYILNDYFESSVNTHNYLQSIIQKGAKNTINITNNTFLSNSLKLPRSREEQQKIADFLSALDRKITHTKNQLDYMQTFKKGLLQQLFV